MTRSGKRVAKRYDADPYGAGSGSAPVWEFYYYGITGQKLVTVSCPLDLTTMYPMAPNCTIVGENVYFGRKQLVSNGLTVARDRVGSVRGNSNGERFTYYPYGEERTSTVDGRDKFGTYFRDSAGQDYADQRYYGSGTGRFWTVDPAGMGSVESRSPLSWNRYLYGSGDPINRFDPTGRSSCDPYYDECYADDEPEPTLCESDSCEAESRDGDDGGGDDSGGEVGVLGANGRYTFSPVTGTSTALVATPVAITQSSWTAGILSGLSTIFTTGVGIILTAGSTSACDTLTCQGLMPVATGTASGGPPRKPKTDPISFPGNASVTGRGPNGECKRPTQYKWADSGNDHGSTSGYHWHWITWNLANPATCAYFPVRGSGPGDPGPDYVLLPGTYLGQ